ncbi:MULTISPECIES: biotin/lipoyl-containing protein [Nocardiopsis]|nr:biotin/lipoyl-containing protein [Nocardiopsis sp. LDBS1602]MEC3894063.1 biotin/lipoyl-containing protein [Nocardiopsis sp. LDBS1602]
MTGSPREQAKRMEDVCVGLGRVLGLAGHDLTRVRITMDGVELEIDWARTSEATPVRVEGPVSTRNDGEEEPRSDTHTVRSPLVGTFYSAPEPGAEPFIKNGQHVEKGDTLAIVEAMKLMNHVAATVSGTIVEVHAQDGQPVEYDQPLVTLSPDSTV